MFRAKQQIGIYTLIERIGRGGFGEVWLAERRAKYVTTKVAVKLPLQEQVDAEAIKKEAHLWERASGHPNIIPIIDADEYDGQVIIVSEYAPDGSLVEVLKKRGSLSITKAVELTIGILNGLEFLHSKEIIHRDIKPENILLQGETPRLADFGISRVMKSNSISINMSGTPAYMSPEAFNRQRTVQTDIWSVGVVLYQMLKGSLPFPHNDLNDLLSAVVRDEPNPLPDSVPPSLQKIILKALAKHPIERYQSAKEMKADLANFLVRISQKNVHTEPTIQFDSVKKQTHETLKPHTTKQPNQITQTKEPKHITSAKETKYAENFRMNPLTLAFSEDEEQIFRDEYSQEFIKQMRSGLWVGFIIYILFGVLDGLLFPDVAQKLWLIRYVLAGPLCVAGLLATYSSFFKPFLQEIVSFVIIIAAIGIIAMSAVAPAPDNALYYAGLILAIMIAFTFVRLRFIYATFVSLIIITTYEIVAVWIAKTPFIILLSNNFFFISANVIGMFACYLIELYIRKEFIQRKLLEKEEAKTKELLLNILPEPIAERLKNGETIIVDKFQNATVLFSDIVGFSELSARTIPESLVVFLNEIFTVIDNVAEKHGLEKIKTVGDAYIVAGGLPIYREDHAEAIADMALEVQEQISKMELAKDGWLRLRIGIHTGAVVAGVIGKKKFSYDLWGNTVNIANQMERNSFGGCILVSQETYFRLKDKYLMIERGEIEIKGKGIIKTYLLVGKIN